MNRKLNLIIFINLFILIHIPVALCITPAPIVYVTGDGSGDFNCDGIDDHNEINQALKFVTENPGYTTVYLKGPFTYVIDDTLLIGSNTTLEGDLSAKIKLVSGAGWKSKKPLIQERSPGSHDITIRCFTIDGNREGNTNVRSGRGYYDLIYLSDCQNISVYGMNLTNNHGDGLKTDNCSMIKFYNNEACSLGHDALYTITCSNVEAYNNSITCRTNSGLRLYNTNHANIYNNNITSQGAGGAGIEIQKGGISEMNDIEVYNNIISKTELSGVLVFGSGSYSNSSANVHIHHNQIYDTGTDANSKLVGGIVTVGFNALIENNVIDGAYGTGIMQSYAYSSTPDGSGYVVTVKNNIITNTRTSVASGNGSGVCNMLTDTHSFVLQNNCFYNNSGCDYIGVQASPSDIVADPQYIDRDNHDYHLKSKSGRWDGVSWVNDSVSSPCIDAGDPSMDYSNEPEPNGNRINIGPDGNTVYASKSELYLTNSSSIISSESSSSGSTSGSSSGSGSSGGAGGSPEPQSNVETKEISQFFITSGNPVKFCFPNNATSVLYVTFDAKKTAGKTTAIIEMLKGKSTLITSLPSDEVYKFLNIWVGNSGFATEKNIENSIVYFKVEKAWTQDKSIDQSSITLNRYSDQKWSQLSTNILGEDDMYLYFAAETPGFSPFAITGKMRITENRIQPAAGTKIQPAYVNETQTKPATENLGNTENTTANIEKTPEQTQKPKTSGKESTKISGFEIIYGIVCLLSLFLHKKNKK